MSNVSVQNFKHCSCCVQTPLVGFLVLWAHYVCKFPGARCQPWLLLSDGFYTCSTMSRRGRVGKHKLCTFGAGGNGQTLVGWHSVYSKDHPLVGIHICPCPYQKETRMCSFQLHQQLDRWYCHAWSYTCSQVLSLMVTHLVLRPLSLSRPTMNTCSGHPNGECIKPQSLTNTNFRSTMWFFRPGSIKIQANFFWNNYWYCLIENRFLCIKCKECSTDCTSALMFVLSILRLSRYALNCKQCHKNFKHE